MEEFKGSKGVWEIDSDCGEQLPIVCDHRAVALIPQKHPNARENSLLISAAPDLLAACMEFVRKCECGEAKSKRSYTQMKAAISKALGQE